MWLFFGLLIVAELGYRIGISKAPIAKQESAETVQQGMLTLLSLLLAFSVSMAESRFEERNSILIDEANAIGTSYLRARLFPGEPQKVLENLLRQYLDARIEFYEGGAEPSKVSEAHRKASVLQTEFWNVGVGLKRDHPSVIVSLLLTSLNQTIDLQGKQDFAYSRRIPRSIVILICLTSALVLGLIGFGYGLSKVRHTAFTGMFTIIVSLTLFVIADLNQPQRGWIQIKPVALAQLKENLKSD